MDVSLIEETERGLNNSTQMRLSACLNVLSKVVDPILTNSVRIVPLIYGVVVQGKPEDSSRRHFTPEVQANSPPPPPPAPMRGPKGLDPSREGMRIRPMGASCKNNVFFARNHFLKLTLVSK